MASKRQEAMLIARYAKILMSLSLAVFCLLVAFDNITDPASNYEFVSHVMRMDTTFPGNELMYRSVTDPLAWQVVYGLIIATQLVCGGLFLAGTMRMWQMRTASADEFNRAKAFAPHQKFGPAISEAAEPRYAASSAIKLPDTSRWSEARPR